MWTQSLNSEGRRANDNGRTICGTLPGEINGRRMGVGPTQKGQKREEGRQLCGGCGNPCRDPRDKEGPNKQKKRGLTLKDA